MLGIKKIAVLFAQILIALAIAGFVFYYLPIHMDEFFHFFDLKYLDKNFSQINYHFGFNAYLKKVPFFDLYIKQPYIYVGTIQSFLFHAFYDAFNIINGKFIYSFVSLIVILFLLKKALKLEDKSLWILITFPPIIFAVMHDAGPVNISIMIFLLSKILIDKIFKSNNIFATILLFIILAGLFLIGLFDKIFIIYLLPSLVIFSLADIEFDKKNYTKLFAYATIIILFILYAYAFLNSGVYAIDYNNEVLVSSKLNVTGDTFPHSIKKLLRDRNIVLSSILRNFDYSFYVERNYDLSEYYKKFPLGIATYFLLAGIAYKLFTKRNFLKNAMPRSIKNLGQLSKIKLNFVFYFASFITLCGTFLVLGGTNYSHHMVFLFIPLLGMLFSYGSYFTKMPLIKFYYFTSILILLVNIFLSKPAPLIRESYYKVHDVIKKEIGNKQTVINFSEWNYYAIESLNKDNKNNFVTAVDIKNKYEFDRLLNFCKKNKLNLVNVFGYDPGENEETMLEEIKVMDNKFHQKKVLLNSKYIPVYMYSSVK